MLIGRSLILKNSLNSCRFTIFLSLTLSLAINCVETDKSETVNVSQEAYDKLLEVQKLMERRDQIGNSFRPLISYLCGVCFI